MALLDVRAEGFDALARIMGSESQAALLDLTEAAVATATESAAEFLRGKLRRAWPRSSISSKVIAIPPRTIGDSLVGTLSVRHDWVDVMVDGKDVPPHAVTPRRAKAMTFFVGKGGERKAEQNPRSPRLGLTPVLRTRANHPGYKGKQFALPTAVFGSRKLAQLMDRVILRVIRRMARGR